MDSLSPRLFVFGMDPQNRPCHHVASGVGFNWCNYSYVYCKANRKRYNFNYAQQGSYAFWCRSLMQGRWVRLRHFMLGEWDNGYTGVILVLGNIYIYGYCFPFTGKYQRLHEGKTEKVSIFKLFSLNQMSLYFTIFGMILAALQMPRPVAVDGLLSPLYWRGMDGGHPHWRNVWFFQNKDYRFGSGRFDCEIYRCTCRGDRAVFCL